MVYNVESMKTLRLAKNLLDLLTSYKRSYVLSILICIFSLTYHISITVFFWHWKVMPMVYYNVISITVFTILLFLVLNQKGIAFSYLLGSLEVIAHQVLGDYFLGSYTSFHHFILLIGLLPYLIIEKKSIQVRIYAFIITIIYIIMATLSLPTRVDIPLSVLKNLRGLNTTLATIIIGSTVMTFVLIADRLAKDLRQQNLTLETELKMASVIQKSFFEPKIDGIKNWDIGYYNKAMLEVSGDLFDFFRTGDNLDGLGIFDVSGHGISAGLVTMIVKNIITQEFSNAQKGEELWEIMNNINTRVIAEKGDIENYLTGILVKTESNKIEFVSAGHPLPILYEAKTGECKFLEIEKREVGVIGIDNFPTFFISRYLDMQQGDELFLYTDGITDTFNEETQEFGKERLLETVKACVKDKPENQIAYITERIQSYRGKAQQSDDITFIILKRK